MSLATACSSVRPDIPGVFYQFQLSELPPSAVCSDLARELAAKLALRIENSGLASDKGQCIAALDNGGYSPRVVVNIGYVVAERRINLEVTEYGALNMTIPSRRH